MSKSGWFKETVRHSLAARGLPTGRYLSRKKYFADLDYQFQSKGVEKSGVDNDNLLKGLKFIEKDGYGVAGSAEYELQKREEDERRKRVAEPSFFDVIRRGLSPQSKVARLRGEEEERRVGAEIVRSRRPLQRLLTAADGGDVGGVLVALSTGKVGMNALTTDEREVLQSSLNVYAMKQVQAELPVSEGVKEQLDPAMRARLEILEKRVEQKYESPLKRELREDVKKAAVGAADLPGLAVAGAVGATKAGVGELTSEGFKGESQQFSGISGQIDAAEQAPMFEPGTNVFIDDQGSFGQFDVPRISDGFGFAEKPGATANVAFSSTNVALGDGRKVKGYTERVQEKVDSLAHGQESLAAADVSGFEKGDAAFRKGDREGLISAITGLQSQEAKLRDRWNLVAQTHAQVQSVQNHESAFEDAEQPLNFFFGSGKGAEKLADQTEKLNQSRAAILRRNNEVSSRRKMLEFRLQRLDSVVPPETWVPKDVTRFQEKGDWKARVKVDNVVLDSLRGRSDG